MKRRLWLVEFWMVSFAGSQLQGTGKFLSTWLGRQTLAGENTDELSRDLYGCCYFQFSFNHWTPPAAKAFHPKFTFLRRPSFPCFCPGHILFWVEASNVAAVAANCSLNVKNHSQPKPTGRFVIFHLSSQDVSKQTKDLMNRVAKYFVILSITIIVVGYLSNFLTYRFCENEVANIVASPFCDQNSETVLYSLNEETNQVLSRQKIKFRPFAGTIASPWIDIYSKIYMPFVVDVGFGWQASELAGAGGYYRFICILGWKIEIKNWKTWVS